jgi:uncharacterized repeat protein (TIGR01451 family)
MKPFAARIKRVALAMMALSALGVSSSAFAALGETSADTDITNTATVNYNVGSVPQTAITSNVATFKVDHKVDLSITSNGPTNTNPGSLDQGLSFTVANEGNYQDTFTLGAVNQAGDQFDVTGIEYYLDNGTTPNVKDAGDTLIPPTGVVVPRDSSVVVLVVSDIPLTATNGQIANVQLTATAAAQTAGADNPNAVDRVWADAGNDGAESVASNYLIQAATLSVVKSAAVVSDPVNGASPNAKAIPGAVVQYTITVTNNGAVPAAAVVLTDNIPSNTTYEASSMTLGGTPLSDAGPTGSTTGSPVTSITINAGTVGFAPGSNVATATFRVRVN